MTEKVTPLALFGGPLERLTPSGEEYERAARKALNPLIERALKEGVKLRELGYILHSMASGLIINGMLQRGLYALRAKTTLKAIGRPAEKPEWCRDADDFDQLADELLGDEPEDVEPDTLTETRKSP
jgi:hypothetical protein